MKLSVISRLCVVQQMITWVYNSGKLVTLELTNPILPEQA